MTNKYFSSTINKALVIVECVAKSTKPLRASQIAKTINLDRATTFRILSYLNSSGYIFKDNSNNLYSLGHKIFEFGDKSDFLKSLTNLCIDHIKNLSQNTQHITYLAVLEGPHIVYCDKIVPSGANAPRAFRMRMDAHSCSLGKAILAYKTKEELQEIYKSYTLYQHTKNTISTLDKLIVELNKIKKNGYSVNEAETFDYVYGIGAPIIDSQNRAIASIAISGTKGSINIKTIKGLAAQVKETARLISNKIVEK